MDRWQTMLPEKIYGNYMHVGGDADLSAHKNMDWLH
jgi:hypothetical protein